MSLGIWYILGPEKRYGLILYTCEMNLTLWFMLESHEFKNNTILVNYCEKTQVLHQINKTINKSL